MTRLCDNFIPETDDGRRKQPACGLSLSGTQSASDIWWHRIPQVSRICEVFRHQLRRRVSVSPDPRSRGTLQDHRQTGSTGGTWTGGQVSNQGDQTTLTSSGEDFAGFMVGWQVQVDAAVPVYLDIVAVDGELLIVSGDVSALVTAEETEFCIIHPVGVNPENGATQTDPCQPESRYLWGGSRSERSRSDALHRKGSYYLPPIAGFEMWHDGVFGIHGQQPGQNKSGQHYMLNRIYDINMGRWTTPDPARSPEWNTNDYVKNTPINQADPTGLQDINPETGEVHDPVTGEQVDDLLKEKKAAELEKARQEQAKKEAEFRKTQTKKIGRVTISGNEDMHRGATGAHKVKGFELDGLDKLKEELQRIATNEAEGYKDACIDTLEIRGHGSGRTANFLWSGSLALKSRCKFRKDQGFDFPGHSSQELADAIGSLLCKPCTIYFHTCYGATTGLAQELADATGCSVEASDQEDNCPTTGEDWEAYKKRGGPYVTRTPKGNAQPPGAPKVPKGKVAGH